jgi:FkbM family methyltransferase
VLDVGAHIGYFSLLASTLTGPSGRVYAFEPEPRNRALLEKNVASNSRANVVVVPKAVSDSAGTARLQLHAQNTGAHSLFSAPGTAAGSVEIETVALGAWMKENNVEPSLIKLDLEGGEWRALEGMSDFVARKRPLALVLEYIPAAITRSGRDPWEWLDRLAKFGFRFSRIDEDRGVQTPMTADQISFAFSQSHCDLLCERD